MPRTIIDDCQSPGPPRTGSNDTATGEGLAVRVATPLLVTLTVATAVPSLWTSIDSGWAAAVPLVPSASARSAVAAVRFHLLRVCPTVGEDTVEPAATECDPPR